MSCRLNMIIECESLDRPLRSCSQMFREEKFLLKERMHYSMRSKSTAYFPFFLKQDILLLCG